MWKIALLFACCAGARAADLPRLQDLLRSAGEAVETFWTDFASVNCTEVVSQALLDAHGQPGFEKTAVYDYLVMIKQTDKDFAVSESRVEAKSDRKREKSSLLVTNGFSMFLLIFHPRFQHSFEFSGPLESAEAGRRFWQVEFRQLRNAPSPSCLRLNGRDHPLQWAGAAWLDPQSGAVVRIRASLVESAEDLGLKLLNAEVNYAPVKFADAPVPQWLPSSAVIEAATPRHRWKNTHQFTNYKHFAVKTNTTTISPQ